MNIKADGISHRLLLFPLPKDEAGLSPIVPLALTSNQSFCVPGFRFAASGVGTGNAVGILGERLLEDGKRLINPLFS